MKIVIAPDSYKESLSASEVAQAIEKDFGKFSLMHSMFPARRRRRRGTVEAMIAATQERNISHG